MICSCGKRMFVRQSPLSAIRAKARTMAGILAVSCGLTALCLPSAAVADGPSVRITAQSELRFGTFLVFGAGARTVSAAGAVTNFALVPVEGDAPSPARFTVAYDRGNQSTQPLDVELDVVIAASSPIRLGGIDARLSALDSTLPGALQVQPGQPVRIRITGCRTRLCSRSFQVGGRIDVTRQSGHASLSIPIPLEATIVSAVRQ
jgi:hypothetical protein